jgi:hypothetical protein
MSGESRSTLLEALREKTKSRKTRLLISGALLVLPAIMPAHAINCGGYTDCVQTGTYSRIWCQSEAGSCAFLHPNYQYNTTYTRYSCFNNTVNYVPCNKCQSTVSMGCCNDTASDVICS